MSDTNNAFDLQGADAADSTPSLIILSELPAFIAFATQLAQQCRQQLYIYSTQLNPELYGHEDFVDACSAFVRAAGRNKLSILVQQPQGLIEHPHPLLRLQHRLPDKIALRTLPTDFDPENIHKLNREYVLGDADKILLQHDAGHYDGFVHFNDKPTVKEFTQKFEYLWGHGESIAALQRLGI